MPGTLPAVLHPEQIIMDLGQEDDPRPLYLVPWIPDSQDVDRVELREKIRSRLLARIGTASLGTLDWRYLDVLSEVSSGLYDEWEDLGSLKGRVFPVISTILQRLLGRDSRVTPLSNEVRVKIESESDRRELIERVRKATLRASSRKGTQLSFEIAP